jgi:hypothetical protein
MEHVTIPVLQKQRGTGLGMPSKQTMITPTLPADINIPSPFLPTTDLEGAGTLSPGCGAVEVEKGKGVKAKKADCEKKKECYGGV